MKTLLKMIAIAATMLCAFNASAARMESTNIIYLDANDNVIGQRAEFCNNIRYRGGVQSGAYTLLVYGGCGDPITTCSYYQSSILCTNSGGFHDVRAEMIGQYGSRNIQQVCSITGACTFHEPTLMWGWGFDIEEI